MGQLVRGVGSIWETWYDILFSPVEAMKTVALEQRKFHAVLSMLAGIIPFWAAYFAISGQSSGLAGALMGLHIIGAAAVWVCGTALLHMAAVLTGGRGEAVGLLCTLGYVCLPQLFLIPIAAIAQYFPAALRPIAITGGLAALALWSFILKVLALRGNYDITTFKALVILLIPVIGLLAIFALAILLFAASALSIVL